MTQLFDFSILLILLLLLGCSVLSLLLQAQVLRKPAEGLHHKEQPSGSLQGHSRVAESAPCLSKENV